ncbi:MAG: MFS transporter [Thermomicrobiales bacterium]|nr:MFS transporter [Thermomicrobiales bacterium]
MRTEANARPLWWLLVSNFVSNSGNTFANLAIPWFVLETTGSAARMGMVVAAGTVPMILVGIFGSAVIDRFGYRRTSIVSDLASALSVIMIPLLHQTIGLRFWQLIALVVLGATLDAPGRTARRSLYPELISMAKMSTERGNALFMTANRTAQLIAPPIAGVLIAMIGPGNLLYVNGISFVIAAAVMALAIPQIDVHGVEKAFIGLGEYVSEVREGFRFLYSRSTLFWMLVSFSIGTLIAEPIFSTILPVYTRDVLQSPVALGLIFSALGFGSLVGNLLYVWVGERLNRSMALFAGFFVRAAAFSVLLFSPSWWVIAAAIFFSAVIFEPINPIHMSVEQEQVPPEMRARVFGASTALMMCPGPIGILLYGFMLEGLGIDRTLQIFVILNLLVPIGMLLIPSLRSIERPTQSGTANA